MLEIACDTNERCVVFLDEFDKTTYELREALLKVTDTGIKFLLLLLVRCIVRLLLNLLQVCIEIAVRMGTTLMRRSAYGPWHPILLMMLSSSSFVDTLPAAKMRRLKRCPLSVLGW
jgi:hypothetical protein